MKKFNVNIACKDIRPGMVFMCEDETQMIIQVRRVNNNDDIELVILSSSKRRPGYINGPIVCEESEMYYAFWEQLV